MRPKAYRRAQEKKAKQKTVQKFKIWKSPELLTDRFIGIHAHSPAHCSCYMCGNPRHHFNNVTVQEKKSDIDMSEQFEVA